VVRLGHLALRVALVIDQVVIVDDDSREILGKFILKTSVVRCSSCSWLSEGVTSDINNVNSLSERQVPNTSLVVNHIE